MHVKWNHRCMMCCNFRRMHSVFMHACMYEYFSLIHYMSISHRFAFTH